MRACKFLIYPSVGDASPNTVSEAMACGLKIVEMESDTMSGSKEVYEKNLNKIYTIQEMADDYISAFKKII